MKKILKVVLIATMMLVAFLALSTAEDITKSTTSTSTTPGPDVTKSTTTTTTPGSGATKSTTTTSTPSSEPTTTTKSTSTTTSTPGFEAPFAVAGILAVALVALKRRL